MKSKLEINPQAQFQAAVGTVKEQVEKATAAATKGFGELKAMTEANMNAAIQSGSVLSKGFEVMGRQFAALTQANVETAFATAQKLAACKNLREASELQTAFAQTAFDKWMSGGSKLTQMGTKMTTEALQPLSARFTDMVEKAGKPAGF